MDLCQDFGHKNLLPPICEKLGIDVPELYVELNVNPNAYTYGDTKPFIVITSGLFETMPDELIPTVLAHECGHIACHHTLYRTMGRIILNGVFSIISGIGNVVLYPVQLAFAYWMRCSEFSADRAAAICDGSSDKVVEMCMRFAGYDKDIMADANADLFMEQAEEYRKMVDDSAWNKTLEFLLFQNYDHPLNAVRAYEAREWAQSERFKNIQDYLHAPVGEIDNKLPVMLTIKKYLGKNIADVQATLLGMGFKNIQLKRETECVHKAKNGTVLSISVNGDEVCKDDFYKCDSEITIAYFEAKTDEEIALEHPGEIKIEHAAKEFTGKNYLDEIVELKNMGFANIVVKEMAIPKLGILVKENTIAKISIDGNSKFNADEWYDPETEILIYYYVSVK